MVIWNEMYCTVHAYRIERPGYDDANGRQYQTTTRTMMYILSYYPLLICRLWIRNRIINQWNCWLIWFIIRCHPCCHPLASCWCWIYLRFKWLCTLQFNRALCLLLQLLLERNSNHEIRILLHAAEGYWAYSIPSAFARIMKYVADCDVNMFLQRWYWQVFFQIHILISVVWCEILIRLIK